MCQLSAETSHMERMWSRGTTQHLFNKEADLPCTCEMLQVNHTMTHWTNDRLPYGPHSHRITVGGMLSRLQHSADQLTSLHQQYYHPLANLFQELCHVKVLTCSRMAGIHNSNSMQIILHLFDNRHNYNT